MYEAAILFAPGLSEVMLADPDGSLNWSRLTPPVFSPAAKPLEPPQEAVVPLGGPDLRAEESHLEAIRTNLEELGQRLYAQQRQRLEEMQQVAVQLAARLASHLVQAHIESGDFAVETLVRKAISFLETPEAVTVYLHPEDLALLGARLEGKSLLEGNGEIRLQPDQLLRRGDCRAETGDVAVLSSWEERLEVIRQELLQGLREAEIERRAANGERNLRPFPDRRQTA